MKYIFNAQFLKITPPYTTFGDAWEALCTTLLREELGHESCVALKAPDRGVDLLVRPEKKAVQCKADERGAIGTISPTHSIESLKTAISYKEKLGWEIYSFATNADYSGSGIEKIFSFASDNGLDTEHISFLGPEYWSELCDKHIERVRSRLDYRLIYSEEEVEDAFRKARYYDSYIEKYTNLISDYPVILEVSNNRTPLILELPFSAELTVKNCLDIVKELLGVDLNIQEYDDLNTTAQASISLTIDGIAQPFSKKIGDLSEEELEKLKFWIKIVYKVMKEKPKRNMDFIHLDKFELKRWENYSESTLSRLLGTDVDPSEETIKRFESLVQNKMWSNVCT